MSCIQHEILSMYRASSRRPEGLTLSGSVVTSRMGNCRTGRVGAPCEELAVGDTTSGDATVCLRRCGSVPSCWSLCSLSIATHRSLYVVHITARSATRLAVCKGWCVEKMREESSAERDADWAGGEAKRGGKKHTLTHSGI